MLRGGASIAPARAGDLPQLRAIELACAEQFSVLDLPPARRADCVPLDRLERARAEGLLWVAVDDRDVPVGFALAGTLDGQLHLEELAVHPSQQAKGLGTALVRAVITEARQRRGTSLTLTTFRFVAWNAPWYERLRFRVLAPQELSASLRAILDREALLGLAPERRVAMRLELTSSD